MEKSSDSYWQLYARALEILEGCSFGHALPIIRKLARRGFSPAIAALSDYVSDPEAIRLLRGAARRGDPLSAHNLAITHRNRGDMLNYRMSVARAARLDPDAAAELRRFKSRFPHEATRRFRSLAPDRG